MIEAKGSENMENVVLTSTAAAVLKKLYSQYKKRIRNGMPKSDAADFGSSRTIHKEFFPGKSFEDIDAACAELLRANLLTGFRADGYLYHAALSDTGIAFSENTASRNASTFFGQVLELVQTIRSLLPW